MNDQEQKAWEELCDSLDTKGYKHLSPDQRIWMNVRVLIDAVNDGGLISFYYNSGADHLKEALADLHTIGAPNIIDLLEQINALFPDRKPSSDIDERNDVISSWHDDEHDQLLEQLDEKFDALEAKLEAKLQPIIKRVMRNRK